MTGVAAAGFITRSFEAMLKECAGKKYPDLRSAVQKLIAYDHLEGDPGLEGGKNASLFTDMLNLVCGCVDNSSLDSTIVQVLQALLTAISSMRFRVHGDPLLGVIRVCYDIALNSKSLVNQATSKAMLTQMISIVFWRTETDQVPVSSGIADAGTPASNTSSENVEKSSDEKGEKNTVADALPKKHENDSSPSLEEFQNLASGADIKVLEAALDQAVQLEDGKKVSGGISVESMSVVQNDALLLFRTLCKMGMNEEGDEVATKMRPLSTGEAGSANIHRVLDLRAPVIVKLLEGMCSMNSLIFGNLSVVIRLRFVEQLDISSVHSSLPFCRNCYRHLSVLPARQTFLQPPYEAKARQNVYAIEQGYL